MIHEVQAQRSATVAAQRSDGEAALVAKRDRRGRTRVADLHQRANAKIRLPRTHDDHLRAVFINTSGGLTGGDRLKWSVTADTGANLTVTTQAAERAYKSAGGHADVRTQISVGADATLAWLPHETILFDGSKLKRDFHVELETGATFLAAETFVLGRQAMRENLISGTLRDRWRICRSGQLIHADDIALDFSDPGLKSVAAAGGRHVLAMLVFAGKSSDEMGQAQLRALHEIRPLGMEIGASALPGRVVVRMAGYDNQTVKSALASYVNCLLPEVSVHSVWNS